MDDTPPTYGSDKGWMSWLGGWMPKQRRPAEEAPPQYERPPPEYQERKPFELRPERCARLDSSQYSILFVDGTIDDYRYGQPTTDVFVAKQPRSVCYAYLRWLRLDPEADFDKIEAWEQGRELLFVKTQNFGDVLNFPSFDKWVRSLNDAEAQGASFERYAATMFRFIKEQYPELNVQSLAEYARAFANQDPQSTVLQYLMDIRHATDNHIHQQRVNYLR